MLRSAFKTALPVAFGYIPLGMAFGVLLQGLGYAWWWAPVMGLVIFAGSAQFLAVSLLAAGASALDAFVATFLLNLRHVFYGLTLLDRYKALGRRKLYPIFGLTDETFSLLAGSPVHPSTDADYVTAVTLFNQGWWVLGCAAGGLLGSQLTFNTAGLEFSMTALFAVLWVEQLLKSFRPKLLIGTLAIAGFCLAVLPGKYFLLAAMSLACLGLVATQERRSLS